MGRSFILKTLWLGLWTLSSCSPGSQQDFRREGQFLCKELIQDLQTIQSREDFLLLEPILKKRFEKLVYVIIKAKEHQIKHSEDFFSVEADAAGVSDLLKEQMIRIYSIEGGREFIERTQREAMLRIDSFEKLKQKQKELRIK